MDDIDFGGPTPAGDLNVNWIHGSRSLRHRTDPPIQVHVYDAHTVIMRQSKDVSFEAPFMYLLFGNSRALLIDTGATADPKRFPLRATVDRLISNWLAARPREDYGLVVAHTHGHRDHTAGDNQFLGRRETVIVQKDVDAVKSSFGISFWPKGSGQCDLGGRVLDVLPTPGHDPRAIAMYDPWTRFLLTGDTVYPGRLYAFDFPSYIESLHRLVRFAQERPVTHVMGCHVEMMRTPRKDYPATVRYQPDEPPLQMTFDQLVAIKGAAESVSGSPGAHVFDDFEIFTGPCHGAVFKQLARASWSNLKHRLGR